MRKTKILAIVPYEGMREVLLQEASRRDDVLLDVFFGDLQDGAAIAKARAKSGYDVIISRGGTAGLIKESVHLPVIDAVPTIYDLLRFVRMADNLSAKFAIVGFANVTLVAKKLFDIIDRDIDIYTLKQSSDAEEVIQRLAKQGYTLIIGDVITVDTAKRFQMNSILIASGEESIQNALNEAVYYQKLIDNTLQHNLFFQDIIEESNLSIVVYNAQEQLLYSSLSDNQLEYQRVFRSLPAYVTTILGGEKFRLIRHTKGFTFEIIGRKIRQREENLAVFYIRRFLDIPQQNRGVVKYYHMLDATIEDPNEPIDNIGSMVEVLENAKRASKTSSPIAILSEQGAPFRSVMYTIYHESSLNLNSLASIDCAIIDAKSFLWLLESNDSPLCETNMTIVFSHFTALDASLQAKYFNFSHHTALHKRNRIIYEIRQDVQLPAATKDFFNKPEFTYITLPSLAQRPQDIPYLANLYLSALNIEMGKQAIGFSENATNHLAAFAWPGNNEQLQRVIRACLTSTTSSLITHEVVQAALAKEDRMFQPDSPTSHDILGTLEEINTRIAYAVLKEENMNRTKTAERLNISRSTLWRMLKD